MDDYTAMAAAERIFVRSILRELFVLRCMDADDPFEAVEDMATVKLGAADMLSDQRGMDDMLSHYFVHSMETFWTDVRNEVRARVEGRDG